MIRSGTNVLKVISMRAFPDGIYTLLKVKVVNPLNDEYTFHYKVPIGSRPHELMDFLKIMGRTGRWFSAFLNEKQRFLSIISVTDPKVPQEEIEDIWNAARGHGILDSNKIQKPERILIQ